MVQQLLLHVIISLYLDVEAAVIARPFMVPNISLLTVLFAIIPVELNENPTFNFMSRRIPISKVQRTVDLKRRQNYEINQTVNFMCRCCTVL